MVIFWVTLVFCLFALTLLVVCGKVLSILSKLKQAIAALEKKFTALEKEFVYLNNKVVLSNEQKAWIEENKANFDKLLEEKFAEACENIKFKEITYKQTIQKKRKEYNRKNSKNAKPQRTYRYIDEE